MRNTELIKKYGLKVDFRRLPGYRRLQEVIIGTCNTDKVSAEELEYIKLHKAEIIAEIRAIEQKEKDEIKAEKQAKIEAIKSGEIKIKVRYHDGEYLSGYTVFDEEAELLEELMVAKDISGWGYRVEDELVKKLGEEFTYEQAVEFAKPALEAEANYKEEKDAKRQAIFDEAKRTGQKQLLLQYSDSCNDPNEDCDVDICYEYAMPDGTIKTERHHTW